jgi:putative endonuclease
MVDHDCFVAYNVKKEGAEGGFMNNSSKDSIRHSGNMNKGKWGEELAAVYLQDKGYQIVFRNFYSKYGELDIIAKKNNLLIFVEVKTRTQDNYGNPAEAVNASKRRHMTYAANFFVQRFGFQNVDLRFDVIEIKLNHLENV